MSVSKRIGKKLTFILKYGESDRPITCQDFRKTSHDFHMT